MLYKCTCKNKYQDDKYGKNIRVFNKMKQDIPQKYRCTVCAKEISK